MVTDVPGLGGGGGGGLGFRGCHNKVPQIRWPRTMEIYSLAALEAGCLKGALVGFYSSGALGESVSFLHPASGGSGHPLASL